MPSSTVATSTVDSSDVDAGDGLGRVPLDVSSGAVSDPQRTAGSVGRVNDVGIDPGGVGAGDGYSVQMLVTTALTSELRLELAYRGLLPAWAAYSAALIADPETAAEFVSQRAVYGELLDYPAPPPTAG